MELSAFYNFVVSRDSAVKPPGVCDELSVPGAIFRPPGFFNRVQIFVTNHTQGFVLNQTMLRVRHPDMSVAFYRDILGMTLLDRYDFESMRFSLYFMGYEPIADIPTDPAERARWVFTRPALLELTHNWGSENDSAFSYHNGNAEPRGFGHIGISVPDVDAACARFDSLGIEFVKRPQDGTMKGLAFIKDPDGYWIEILSSRNLAAIVTR